MDLEEWCGKLEEAPDPERVDAPDADLVSHQAGRGTDARARLTAAA
jgi:hypothetical protein